MNDTENVMRFTNKLMMISKKRKLYDIRIIVRISLSIWHRTCAFLRLEDCRMRDCNYSRDYEHDLRVENYSESESIFSGILISWRDRHCRVFSRSLRLAKTRWSEHLFGHELPNIVILFLKEVCKWGYSCWIMLEHKWHDGEPDIGKDERMSC